MLLAMIAVALGLAVALAVAKFFNAFLYGVQPHDLLTFTIVPAFLIAVTFVACWLPSRRASMVDPLKALHYD
jgi:ABC-type lipoprotein release transport system permease subunit